MLQWRSGKHSLRRCSRGKTVLEVVKEAQPIIQTCRKACSLSQKYAERGELPAHVENRRQSLPECGQDKGDVVATRRERTRSVLLWALTVLPWRGWVHVTEDLSCPRKLSNDSTPSVSWEGPEPQAHHVLVLQRNHREHPDLTVWNGACTASCCKTLHGIVRAAEKTGGTPFPFLQNIYSTHLTRKGLCVTGDRTK